MDIRIPQSNVPSSAVDEAITKEMHDRLGRATTTASSLAAEQGSGTISKTQTKATPSGPSSPRTSLEGGLECHFTIGDSLVQARPKRLSNFPDEPPLGEVTSLENELTRTKDVYNKALITLTKRVKKLEKQLKHRGRRAVIDFSDDAEPREAQETVEHRMEFSNASPQTADDETLAETLLNIKRSATKDKGKRVWDQNHTFVPMDFEIEKKVMKRYGFDLQQESSKKQKLDEQTEVQVDSDQEEDEMKKYMKIVPGEEITIDAIPLANKPLVIVDWKIIKIHLQYQALLLGHTKDHPDKKDLKGTDRFKTNRGCPFSSSVPSSTRTLATLEAMEARAPLLGFQTKE
nr:hypothetical protein [Tanacetum cinerariifolium]